MEKLLENTELSYSEQQNSSMQQQQLNIPREQSSDITSSLKKT